MKKLKYFGIALSTILALGTISTAAFSFANGSLTTAQAQLANPAGPGTYYSSISSNLSGDDLLNALNALNNSKRTKLVGYAGMRQFAAKSDADPDGSGKIIGFYDNTKVGPSWDSGNTWNREHVWPNVRGGSSVEGDAHMTRPASTKTNSDRGSKGYGSTSYDPGQFVEYYRGAAARIIFYAAIADTNLKLIDDPLNYNGGNPANSMGSLSEMLKWNLEYLPSDTSFTGANDLARRTELNRNEVIQNNSAGQGNRNPFIDHPEYACKIWGNTNSKTKEICKGNLPDSGDSSSTDTSDSSSSDVPPTPTQDTPLTNPSVETTYKMGFFKTSEGNQYYATGNIVNDYYGEALQDKSVGADVQLLNANGGYHVKMTKGDGSIVYLGGEISGTHTNIKFDTTAKTVWKWNSQYNTLTATIDGTEVYPGTYKTYTTLSLSKIDYIANADVDHAHLYALDGGGQGGGGEGGDSSSTTSSSTETSSNSEGYTTTTDSTTSNEEKKGGGGCSASINSGNSSLVFFTALGALFIAIRMRFKKKED